MSLTAGTCITTHFGFHIFFHAGTCTSFLNWTLSTVSVSCCCIFEIDSTTYHASFLTGTQIGFQIFFHAGTLSDDESKIRALSIQFIIKKRFISRNSLDFLPRWYFYLDPTNRPQKSVLSLKFKYNFLQPHVKCF